nr:oxidoreductase [Flexivirga meconopsidis]
MVTGASSGIGMATARKLASEGYAVYAAARRVERMKELETQGITPIAMDVTDDASMRDGVDRILGETGRIDVLVNNAGYGSYGAIEDVPPEEARRQFDVNVFGLARLIQLVTPQMRERGDGYIVNVSSIGGKIYTPFGGWYHATKFAVEGLSDALRLELAPFGIKVVIIEPGAIDTEWGGIAGEGLMARSGGGAYAEQVRHVARMLGSEQSGPMRGSKPEVVANAIAKAVRSSHPRSRYAIGMGAKPITYARRVLPDRVIDGGVKLMFGAAGRMR